MALGRLLVDAVKRGAKKASLAVPVPRRPLAVPVPETRAVVAPAGPVRPVQPKPRRLAVPVPPKPAPPKPVAPLALPSPEMATPLKPRGRQWWPDVELTGAGAKDPRDAGWTVHDRGEHADPGHRYMARLGGIDFTETFHPTEQAAWGRAAQAEGNKLVNMSPERAARKAASEAYVHWGMEDDSVDWLEKALGKYLKRDYGTEGDPLLGLAERGLHYDPGMTPAQWSRGADDFIAEDPIGYYTVPPPAGKEGLPGMEYDPTFGPSLVAAAPWLAKQPVTEPLLGLRDAPDLDHFMDEFKAALDPNSPLPPDLRVNPASLGRMSFPQAAERVGRINKWRADNLAEASLAAQANPAIRTHKDYPDEGMRWVELRAPDLSEDLGGYRIEPEDNTFGQGQPGHIIYGPDGEEIGAERTVEKAQGTIRDKLHRQNLSEALRYEGDTMGHCVGGYCDDVMRGDSRIFSLRDAKGQPHVTVETSPGRTMDWLDEIDEVPELADAWNQTRYGNAPDPDLPFRDWLQKHNPDLYAKHSGIFERKPERIVQIKGKQNDAPSDKYLPYVQDFVKSQPWSEVDELPNARLVQLPDGRFLDETQFEGIINDMGLDDRFNGWNFRDFPRNPRTMDEDDWGQFSRYFEGYAYGGRVEKDRNWARGPLAVY